MTPTNFAKSRPDVPRAASGVRSRPGAKKAGRKAVMSSRPGLKKETTCVPGNVRRYDQLHGFATGTRWGEIKIFHPHLSAQL